MSPLLAEALELVDNILETDRSEVIVNHLELKISNYYYIMVYGLNKYGLKKHQVRQYIDRLIEKDRAEWEEKNSKKICFDHENRRVYEEVEK